MTSPSSHDTYLSGLGGEFAPLLHDFRLRLAALLPQAEEVISYAMPGFRIGKHVIAGYAGWVKHASLYPHSGGIVPKFMDEIQALGLGYTKSAVHFTATKPFPMTCWHAWSPHVWLKPVFSQTKRPPRMGRPFQKI